METFLKEGLKREGGKKAFEKSMVFFCTLAARWLVFHCNLKNFKKFHLLDYENTLSTELELI